MKQQPPTPPQWADRFLAWFCAEELLEEIQGDLHEAHRHRVQQYNKSRADWLFVADVFQFFKPYAFEGYSRAKQFLPMYQNYLKIALRNILHRKGFTTINLFGLAIGVSAVLLIALYLRHETTYDHSIPDGEHIYRLTNGYRSQIYHPLRFNDYSESTPEKQLALPNHLENYSEVVSVCQFTPSQSAISENRPYFAEVDGQQFTVENILYTNTGRQFLEIFPQAFVQGRPEVAFSNFNKLVLSATVAERWFGDKWEKQDLMGKMIDLQGDLFELTGIVRDPPDNVHFNFDVIAYQPAIPSWAAYTYMKLLPGTDVDAVEKQLNQNLDQVFPGYWEDELSKGISALALHDIHFNNEGLYELKSTANKAYLYTFGLVAFIILVVIWTNYTNLSVAMYANRQKELGMRKVLGAGAKDISFQLLSESLLLALACAPICWLIVRQTLPYFGDLMQFEVSPAVMWSPFVLLSLAFLLFLSGLLSGLYPALTYGRRSPLWLFGKKLSNWTGSRHFNFRSLILTAQFVMVVGLLGITYFIYRQMEFISTKDLGYQKEGVIYFDVSGADQYQELKAAFQGLPEVASVGANGVPGSEMYNQLTYKLKDTEQILSDGTEQYIDYGTLQTLGVECAPCELLAAGKEQVFVINRTAAEKLASIKQTTPEELIGTTLITEPEWENEEYGLGIPHVIDGIIEDYKYFSLKYPDQSQLLTVTRQPGWVYEMMVKINTGNWVGTLKKVEQIYQKVETERPFEAQFLEDRLARLYDGERRAGLLMGGLSIITILLSFLGLAGTVSFMAYSRQKEIGIRKVLGASTTQILLKFNREFLRLLGIAIMVALPPALILSIKWLDNFAFRIEVHPWGVIGAGLGVAILVILLVSIQSIRAANSHPVEVLKVD